MPSCTLSYGRYVKKSASQGSNHNRDWNWIMELNKIKYVRHLVRFFHLVSFPGGSVVNYPPANARDAGLIPDLGRCPGGGNGNPLQYSCLENSMDRGAWWTTVHRVAKSGIWLSDWTHPKKNRREKESLGSLELIECVPWLHNLALFNELCRRSLVKNSGKLN